MKNFQDEDPVILIDEKTGERIKGYVCGYTENKRQYLFKEAKRDIPPYWVIPSSLIHWN